MSFKSKIYFFNFILVQTDQIESGGLREQINRPENHLECWQILSFGCAYSRHHEKKLFHYKYDNGLFCFVALRTVLLGKQTIYIACLNTIKQPTKQNKKGHSFKFFFWLLKHFSLFWSDYQCLAFLEYNHVTRPQWFFSQPPSLKMRGGWEVFISEDKNWMI